MVLRDREPDVLEQRRLPRLGRRDDEAALPLADGRHEVEHTQGELRPGFVGQTKRFLRTDRREVREVGQQTVLRHIKTTGLLNFYDDLDARGITAKAFDLRAIAQGVLPHDGWGNDHVFARRQVVLIRLPYKPTDTFSDFGDSHERECLAFGRNLNLPGILDWSPGTLRLVSLGSRVPLRVALGGPLLPVASMPSP
jgi:hypothetical protein